MSSTTVTPSEPENFSNSSTTQLPYCSQLWNPYMIKDTIILQRQATKFILADYDSDYKTRLLQLGILYF